MDAVTVRMLKAEFVNFIDCNKKKKSNVINKNFNEFGRNLSGIFKNIEFSENDREISYNNLFIELDIDEDNEATLFHNLDGYEEIIALN